MLGQRWARRKGALRGCGGDFKGFQSYLKLENERILFLVRDRSCGEFLGVDRAKLTKSHIIYIESTAHCGGGRACGEPGLVQARRW